MSTTETTTFSVTTECHEARVKEFWTITVPAELVPATVDANQIDKWLDSLGGPIAVSFNGQAVDQEGDRTVTGFEVTEPVQSQPAGPSARVALEELIALHAAFEQADEEDGISGGDLVDYMQLVFARVGIVSADES